MALGVWRLGLAIATKVLTLRSLRRGARYGEVRVGPVRNRSVSDLRRYGLRLRSFPYTRTPAPENASDDRYQCINI